MQIPAVLMLSVALAIGLVGIAFLLFPNRISQLEARLNSPCGNRELASLRLGLRKELAIEEMINQEVLAKEIVWDGWSRRHPRLVGAALCLLALWLGWQV